MKAKEAPEKIYIIKYNDYSDMYLLNAFTEKETNNDIEYTRTDAFIEKAAEWFKLYVLNNDTIDIFEMEDEFKNYMK